MVQEQNRFCYGGGESTRESLKKAKLDKPPHRGLGIAELEKLRTEEWQKELSPGELVFHPLNPQPNTTTVPFLPFGYNVLNFPMFRSQLLDSSPLVSSDGTLPLLWNSFQSDNSSSSNSQLSLATSALNQPPWESQAHQQITQVVNRSSLHSVPGAGLQMELELPSNQSYYGIVNPSSWADQQLMMHQKPESAGSNASEGLAFYNFMDLPYSDFVAERDMVVNKRKRRREGSDDVDVDLKL